MRKQPNHIKYLRELRACDEAVEWAATKSSMEEVWRDCQRGDWMGWLAGRLAGPPISDSRRPLALAAAECARLVPHLNADPRVLACIELVERFGNGGDVSLEEMRATSDAASVAYAASASYVSYVSDAADAAYDVAASAYAVVFAAYASDASYAVAAAITYASVVAARKDTLARCADIFRKHYPSPPTDQR